MATKEDFERAGRDDAKNGRPATPPARPGLWQHRHYLIGFNSMQTVTGRLVNDVPALVPLPIDSPGSARVKAAFKLPTRSRLVGRAEHIRLLRLEINSGKIMTGNRHLRIAAKIAILQGREKLGI